MRTGRGIALVVASLLLVGCGGDDAADAPQSAGVTAEDGGTATADAAGDAGDAEDAAASGECTSGMGCADGLIPELADFPVPDTVDEFSQGSPDLGGQSSQSLYLDAAPADVAAFYEQALPEAGFEVTPRESMDADDFQWDLVAPDGRAGSIWIRTASSHESQAQLSLEVA